MQFGHEPCSGKRHSKPPFISRILDRTVSRKTRMKRANKISWLDHALGSEDLSIGEVVLNLKNLADHQQIEHVHDDVETADVKTGFLGRLIIKSVMIYTQRRHELAELDREIELIEERQTRILTEDVFYLAARGRHEEIAEDWISVLGEQLIADTERHLDQTI